ncbi:3-phosphoshikimate 1-carboxyvinyltransferase [Microscilla marina]|uniref:3-phosphoshikimate 1-carboxyvinyltransferase n=1 Tax=Microscilla marina ATCC 23134 TaxID=313606 RepID=A1ZQH1_MICM2|nr:3-phosphoshikimate 1-carboxyvinyltransferase [Microscilla marina]EAY27343.1 3-phosphoshikimate 1-carboxyvinyltransferase [Microscilla marina ATCC 23134]
MMTKMIHLKILQTPIQTAVQLPSSKSESNRALIIQALAKYQQAAANIKLSNISEARDTQTLQRLLGEEGKILDVLDAGTTMRFLTAFIAVTQQHKILTGTARMQSRPIGILAEALKSLGASIEFLKHAGYPPIEIHPKHPLQGKAIQMRGDISSQYISALLMIAPLLPEGLDIELTGKINSRPYIEMTLQLMMHFGIQSSFEGNHIKVAHQTYQANQYAIESDWSGASYWYAIVALSENTTTKITLKGLRADSLQGDRVIVELMQHFGVKSTFVADGVVLEKVAIAPESTPLELNFAQCPDLAQTVAVVAAAKGMPLQMKGLESLKIKETDRVNALQQELKKVGSHLEEKESQAEWLLHPGAELPTVPITIQTYEDHRMAMAFAPLACLLNLNIEDPEVVAKSYPRFWDDLQKAGMETKVL